MSCFNRLTMADGEVNRKVKAVSAFLRKSCRQRPAERFSLANIFHGCSYPLVHPVDGSKCKMLPVTSGSAAEFYIEPMLSCVGDTDVMYHYSSELAVPAWYPPPSQLPTDFESRVKVYEIVDSHLPGYVYLNLTYILTMDRHDGNYKIAEHVSSLNNTLSHGLYVPVLDDEKGHQHGPACRHEINDFFTVVPGVLTDVVPCIHCFAWPPQASDFPKRNSNCCSWPDAATVDHVIRQGCDVVGVAHRQCMQDEWMSKHQWRLSFSRAEILLLNSWMPVQQIIYHMLRVFVKTERLTDSAVNCEAVTLSNYHIKMLMLWACELKPRQWWNDGSSIVGKCLQMLQFLVEWFTKNRGQHYFLNNVHFIDDFDEFCLTKITAIVRSTTEDSLAQWFVDNYIRKCAEICPDISLVFIDITDETLEHTTGTLLQWSDYVSGKNVMKQIFSYVVCCSLPVILSFQMRPFDFLSTIHNCIVSPLILNFPQKDAVKYLFYFVSSFTDALNWCQRFPRSSAICSFLFDANASALFVTANSADEKHKLRCFTLDNSELFNLSPLQKAVTLMEVFANKRCSRSTREITLVALSKAYLQLMLTDNRSDHESTYCLVNVYLAVLHYTTGQYQKATDHCTLVTRSQDHLHCSLNVVQGNLLPKIDDQIDNVLGLTVLYQYVLAAAVNQSQQRSHVNVFTTEMFAHYFSIKHLLLARCHLMSEVQQQSAQSVEVYLREEMKLFFNTMVSAPRLFVTDLMLCKLPNNRTVNTAYDCISGNSGKRQLARLVTLSIQQLLTYRHLPGDTVSEMTGFLALYLYRCHLYERCDRLCRLTISQLIDAEISSIPLVFTSYHEFIQLMDEDVVSLVGLTVLVDRAKATLWFREPITINHLTLSLYLLTKCQHPDVQTNGDTLSALATILDWIVLAQKKIPFHAFVDHLMLKLTERMAVYYITQQLNGSNTYSATDDKNKIVSVKFGFRIDPGHLVVEVITAFAISKGNAVAEESMSWALASIPY